MKYLMFALMLMFAQIASATSFYVGPIGTAKNGQGTLESPFSSITEAFSSGKIKGGDLVLLLNGNYGDVVLKNIAPSAQVTIRSMTGRGAVFDRVSVEGKSSNLRFMGISVIWSRAPSKWNSLFSTTWETSHIVLSDSTIKAHPDGSNFRKWTAQEWIDRSATGINLNGSFNSALRNSLVGVGFGIQVNGSDHLVERNTVNGFSGDGLRGNGDRLTFRANRVTNCVLVDGNHADAFQSFNLRTDKRPMDGILIERNVIIESTYVTRMPLACELQGIGMFDGMWSNLMIRNNYVEVSAYHGITVAGAVGVSIVNNTVAQSSNGRNRPWILVDHHKDRRQSSNVVIANNVSASKVIGPFAPGIQNVLTGADLVDKADPAFAPPADISNKRRGAAPDIGAREIN